MLDIFDINEPVKLYCGEFLVVKVTEHRVYLNIPWLSKPKMVGVAWLKKYAEPTKDLAIASFIKRRVKQIEILRNQILTAEDALTTANDMLARGNL